MTEQLDVDLTTSTIHWKNNACLNPGGNESWAYMEGFRLLADVGADYVMCEHRSQDMLVYSILFNYRHYIELACKRLISMHHWLHNEAQPKSTGHKLSVLWPITRPIIEGATNSKTAPELLRTDKIIQQFQEWDDGGDSFRYHTHTDGRNTLPGVDYIGIDTVKVEMETVHLVFDFADTMISKALRVYLIRMYSAIVES